MYKNIYDNLYGKKQKRLDLLCNPRIKIMLALVDNLGLKNKKILDVGCYDGTFLSLIKNRDNEFYAIEASEYGFSKTKEKGIAVEKFFFNNTTPFPYKNRLFDLIIIGEIIEHIYDVDFFLSEIRRIICDDGYLVVSTPNIASLGRRLMLLLGVSPIIEISLNAPDSSGHIRYFTFKSLKTILERYGFNVIHGSSDVINFTSHGKVRSLLIPKLFSGLGQSVIYLCKAI